MSEVKKNTKDKAALVPRLRFPEFREAGEWNEKPLKLAALINPSNSGLPESFIYIDLESVEAGVLKVKARISRVDAPSRAQRLVERGDVIYQVVRPYQRNNLLCEFEDSENYVASTGYAQLRAKDGSSHFLYQSIHTDSFVGRVMKKCTGSSYPAINSSDLAEAPLPLPPTLAEQQKIADCLSSLDDLIAAESQKLDTLKTHKKGLMQQLFPQEGEIVPRLRFPEFREAGEWAETVLGDVSEFASGGTPSKNISEYWGGSLPWISASSMYETDLHKSDLNITDLAVRNGARIAKKGTLLILVRGSMLYNRVPMGIASVDVSFNQDVKALTIKNGINDAFLLHELLAYESRIPVDKTGIGAGKIETDELKRFPICIPSSIEQQRVASCLSNLVVVK